MKLRLLPALAGCLLAAGGPVAAQAFSVTITVDENGNGRLTNTAGFNAPLPFSMEQDPGPGGLPGVCTYNMLNPPGLIEGDLLLTDADVGGAILDVVRFNPQQNGGSLVFYSDNIDGFDAICDTASPPGGFYTNTFATPEIGIEGGNGAIYTPLPGQPGFVAGAAGPVTYVIISDTPEPGAAALLCGLLVPGTAFVFRGRRAHRG